MSSTSDFNNFVRANLPSGITFDSTLNRYFVNGKKFNSYTKAKWYLDYIVKFGFEVGSAPTITSAGSAAGTFQVGETVTITAGTATASEGGTISYEYRHTVDGALRASTAAYTFVTGDAGGAALAQWRAVESGGGATPWQTADGETVQAAVVTPTTISFGALTLVNEGGAPLTAANGDYGPYQVLDNVVTPRVSLTNVSTAQEINGTTIAVPVANTRTVAGESELQAALHGAAKLTSGATLALRDIGRVYELRQHDGAFNQWWDEVPAITVTSADTTQARLDRWQLGRVNTDGFVFDNLKFELSTPYPELGDFWAQYGRSGDRFILTEGGGIATNLTIRNCHFDGGLAPWIEGGRLTTTTGPISAIGLGDGFLFEDNLVERTSYGLQLDRGVSNALVQRNTFQRLHADSLTIQNSTTKWSENIVYRDNFTRWPTGYSGDLHTDGVQFQPIGNSSAGFRNIDIFGNVFIFGNRYKPVAGCEPVGPDEGPEIVNITSATTINTAEHHANELRVRTNANITMPSAASVPGTVFSFRGQSGFSSQIVLNGADTWDAGAAPIVGDNGLEYATFESDGTSVWKQVKGGLRAHHMNRRASFTLSDLELGGRVAFIDASNGDVDISLPTSVTGKYYLMREDQDSNRTAQIVAGTNTLLHHGSSVSAIDLPVGYGGILDYQGGTTWVFSEDPHDAQGIFSNPAAAGATDRFQNINIHSNILQVQSTHGVLIEAPASGSVYNNVLVRWLKDQDLNGDGVVGVYEGDSPFGIATLNISGEANVAHNNIVMGQLNLDPSNLLPGAKEYSNIIGDCFSNAAAITFSQDHLAGQTYAAYDVDTREEAIAAYTTKAGSTALTGFAGATPHYDFVNRTVRTQNLPAPSLVSTTPAHEATEIANTGTTVRFTFDGPIVAGSSGSVVVRTGGNAVETFNVSTGAGDAGGTLTFENGEAVLALGGDLAIDTRYSIQITAGTFVHKNYGTSFAGISDDTTLFFDTQSGAIGYGNAIAGGDSPVASPDLRYPTTHQVTHFGQQWIRNSTGTDGEQAVSIDARPPQGPTMTAATRALLDTPGNFVVMFDWRNPGAGIIRLRSSSWGNIEFNLGNTSLNADGRYVHAGNLDVSALYGQPAGTVYRTFGEYTVSSSGQWFVFGDLTKPNVRRPVIFGRTTFSTGNSALEQEIAALAP